MALNLGRKLFKTYNSNSVAVHYIFRLLRIWLQRADFFDIKIIRNKVRSSSQRLWQKIAFTENLLIKYHNVCRQ